MMTRLNQFQIALLAFLVIQNTTTVLVGRRSRTAVSNREDLYSIEHVIILTELGKLILAAIFEEHYSEWGLKMSLKNHIFKNPRDALKMIIPAILYFIQNMLLYVALSNLTVPVFQVTYQSRLLLTALLSVLMLGRNYQLRQWICLGTLALGICFVIMDNWSYDYNDLQVSSAQGLAAVLFAGLASSFAMVYFEKLIKASSSSSSSSSQDEQEQEQEHSSLLVEDTTEVQIEPPTTGRREEQHDLSASMGQLFVHLLHDALKNLASMGKQFWQLLRDGFRLENQEEDQPVASLWMRTMQLSFFCVIIAIGRDLYNDFNDPSQSEKSFFHGFTFWVWLLVFLQSIGGILVAAVIKYADSVIKGLATGVSVVLSSFLSTMLLHTTLTLRFTVGSLLVLGSVFGFGFHITGGPQMIPRESRRPQDNDTQNLEDSLATPLLIV